MKNWLQNNLSKIKQALFKTGSILPDTPKAEVLIDEELYENLLEKLIKADVGLELSEKIIEYLRKNIKEQTLLDSELKKRIKEAITNIIANQVETPQRSVSTSIFLLVGVNGSGKTTSIGKLAKKFKEEGYKVLIVAGDTFRAAAGEQLDIWAQRAEVEIFSPPEIKKPDVVVYAGIEKAKKENFNVVLIDTAGRLHSQTNLMDELKKIDSVIKKHAGEDNVEKLIVLDATIGQNAIVQAEMFSKAINLTGIILSKLDSSAKGGVVLNIMHKHALPITFIGTGEKVDDIAEFNLDEYLDGLLS